MFQCSICHQQHERWQFSCPIKLLYENEIGLSSCKSSWNVYYLKRRLFRRSKKIYVGTWDSLTEAQLWAPVRLRRWEWV